MVLRDFVIVQELELDWNGGFTVLTGETGAGKSILIDALQLVLGARADSTLVREGAARCDVAVEFEAPASVQAWLEEHGLAQDDPAEPLLLRRSVDGQGRSRAWINGHSATVAQLKALGEQLVDIHGQHAWQGLTRPHSVRELLDGYGRIDTSALREHWQRWRERCRELDAATQQQATQQQERERLQWQIGELDKLNPQPGEWDELNLQHGRLAHAQSLTETAQRALQLLDEDEAGACALIYRAVQALQDQQHIEPRFEALAQVLDGALAQLQDTCHDLQQHAHRTETDPATLAALDERLASWLHLARRYRCAPEALPQRLQDWRDALAALERQADIATLQQEERQAYHALRALADTTSAARARAAQQLSAAITGAMQELGMAGGRFTVHITPLAEPQAHGLDQVEFLVAGHAGSTPRAIGKVASGGELSRIALAIAVTTSQLGSAPTLVFDEVDSGIGGTVAHTVGRLMRQLGHDRQVLAVTHLPQVAACAHHHLQVRKHYDASHHTTLSDVQPLDTAARVQELARMLGGGQLSATSLAHAQEMLHP